MDGETVVVIGILLGIAIMITVLVLYQRGKERRLAVQTEIEIPVMSLWRSVAVIVAATVVGPVGMALVGAFSSAWLRENAAVVVLSMLVGCGLLIPLGLWLSRGWRRDGVLRHTADELSLEVKDGRHVLDLRQPFELIEGRATGPGDLPLQVVVFLQGGKRWGFSYGLPIARKPYGDTIMEDYPMPMLGGEVRVIHDRLRARQTSPRTT